VRRSGISRITSTLVLVAWVVAISRSGRLFEVDSARVAVISARSSG